MTTFLIMLVLGAPGNECPFNAVCATSHNGAPATATITLSATIVSAKALTMDIQPLEVKEAYAVNLSGITTGIPDAATVQERYLVIDDAPSSEEPLVFALEDHSISYSNPRNVFVMNIPNGMDMPKGKELVAMVDAVMLVKNPAVWLASVRTKHKSKRATSRR